MTSVPLTMFQAIRHLLEPADETQALIALVQAYEGHRETVPLSPTTSGEGDTWPSPSAQESAIASEKDKASTSATVENTAGDSPVKDMPKSSRERAEMRMGKARPGKI